MPPDLSFVPVDHDPFADDSSPQLERIPPQMNIPAQQQWGAQAAADVLGNVTGISDAAKAWRGEMTPEEQRNFALTAVAGMIPGARALKPAMKAAEEAAPSAGRSLSKTVAEYAGEHGAPDAGSGSPLHDVTANGTYPADFYSHKGLKYYAPGNEGHMDAAAYNKIRSFKDKPDELVDVWRAIPWEGKRPGYALGKQNINPGDWVAINRQYAIDHGESALNGQYAIAKARVPARELFTAGDSFHEWGWDPQGVTPTAPSPPAIRAYHGSPYDFEKFDLSKIGTGEGAQAYGHGLYFAEEPKVAADYKKVITSKLNDVNRTQLSKDAAAELGSANKYLPWAILKEMEQGTPHDQLWSKLMQDPLMRGRTPQEIDSDLDFVKRNYPEHAALPGRMYEVSISADPDHFLHWDKPLSEQSPKVQEAMLPLMRTPSLDVPGQVAYSEVMAQQALNKRGGWLPKANAGEATQALREAGIPGIKYLDQGSRGPGTLYNVGVPTKDFGPYTPFTNRADAEKHAEMLRSQGFKNAEIKTQEQPQTHNYVVFDDKLVNIIKKYGLAGLTTMGAAHFSTTPVEGDPFEEKKRAAGGRVTELQSSGKPKLSHKAVGYVPRSPFHDRRCGLCSMFVAPQDGGPCTLVVSPIGRDAYCRRFDRKKGNGHAS